MNPYKASMPRRNFIFHFKSTQPFFILVLAKFTFFGENVLFCNRNLCLFCLLKEGRRYFQIGEKKLNSKASWKKPPFCSCAGTNHASSSFPGPSGFYVTSRVALETVKKYEFSDWLKKTACAIR